MPSLLRGRPVKTIDELAVFLEAHAAKLRIVSPGGSSVRAWCASISNDQSYGSGCDDTLAGALAEAVTSFESTERHDEREVNGYEAPPAINKEKLQ